MHFPHWVRWFLGVWVGLIASPFTVLHAAPVAGNPWRGQQVFFDPKSGDCIRCHALDGVGGKFGPDLSLVGRRLKRAEIRESILEPDRVLAQGLRVRRMKLSGGREFVAAPALLGDGWVELVRANGATERVRKTEIRSSESLKHSLMPADFGTRLTPGQIADVVAYCESLQSDPRTTRRSFPPKGFTPLFDGRSLSGFKPTPSWTARHGILVHEGEGEHLWHTRDLGDFDLMLEWRWPDRPKFEEFPVIGADGYEQKTADGKPVLERVLDAGDSGVLLRGLFKAQANLFCYPVGSGEFWEYREEAAGLARQSFSPRMRADRPIGQWNAMRIRLVGDRVSIWLNGVEVIHETVLPGIPRRGPIGFQHEHGGLELRNIWVREL